MRDLLFLGLFFVAFTGQSQSIGDLVKFSKLDSIKELKTWVYEVEPNRGDTSKYEIRYKIWGKGCKTKFIEQEDPTEKCNFYIQEQNYYKNGVLEMKHGTWGFVQGTHIHESQIYKQYNDKGRLRIKKRSKRN